MSRRRTLLAAGVVTAVVAAAVIALGSMRGVAQPPPPSSVPQLDGNVVRFSAVFAQRAGIHSQLAEERELSPVLEVNGVVQFDPRLVTAVGARINGRVRAVMAYEGDVVREGQVLAELESAELGRAQADVIKMRAREIAALAQQAREKRLAEAKISSQRDAEIAQAEAEAAGAERLAAEQTVRALGGEIDAKDVGILRLRAPIAGHITSPPLRRGQMVDHTTNAFNIANFDRVWIELAVFEQDLAFVSKGDEVELLPDGVGGAISATVAHVGGIIDQDTRSAKVRVEVDNTKQVFRPGQALHARIVGGRNKARFLSVPTEAVSRVDGKATVFVLTSETTAEIRSVKVGPRSGTHSAILTGLKAGERVVSEGAFALKSEIFR